jgi:maleylpyruvate isomerase
MLKLHGYWRSGTSYRTRIALNLKGIAYEQVGIDLRQGVQRSPEYLALNPQGLVPALEVDGRVLVQSPAILEWLEEAHPEPPLLPRDPADRAEVRAMAALIGCDVHPLNNLRVLKAVAELGGEQSDWTARWITAGFEALERHIERRGGRFSFGDGPTLADCYLVPQVYSARRFEVDLSPFPRITAVDAALNDLAAVAAAHPDRQPDADR